MTIQPDSLKLTTHFVIQSGGEVIISHRYEHGAFRVKHIVIENRFAYRFHVVNITIGINSILTRELWGTGIPGVNFLQSTGGWRPPDDALNPQILIARPHQDISIRARNISAEPSHFEAIFYGITA